MLLLIPRERCLSASDCASEPSRSCLLGFTRHAGDIQPRANLSYPTSPDICEYPVEKSRTCKNSYAVTSPRRRYTYCSFSLKRKRSDGLKPTDFQKEAAVLLAERTSSPISSTFKLLHSSIKRFAKALPTPFRRQAGLTKKSFTVMTRPSSADGVYTARATPIIIS